MNTTTRDVLVHTVADVRWLVEHGSFVSAAKRLGELRLMLERVLSAETALVQRGDSVRAEDAERPQAEINSLERTLDSVASAITHETAELALAGLGTLERLLVQHERTARTLLSTAGGQFADANR